MGVDPLEDETIAATLARLWRINGHEIGVIDVAGSIGLDLLHGLRRAKLLRNRIQLFH